MAQPATPTQAAAAQFVFEAASSRGLAMEVAKCDTHSSTNPLFFFFGAESGESFCVESEMVDRLLAFLVVVGGGA